MLNAKNFALAAGILYAAGAIILAFTAGMFDYGTEIVNFMSIYYIGYETTIVGAIIGAVWAFLDAFIGCYIFVWLYNKLNK